jgi:hypothetical protein
MLQAPHCQRDATGDHGEDEDERKLRNLGLKHLDVPNQGSLQVGARESTVLEILHGAVFTVVGQIARGLKHGNDG